MSSLPAGIKKTIISPPLMYLCGGVMKIIMVPGNGKQMCFLSMVLYGDLIKNVVNGKDLIHLSLLPGDSPDLRQNCTHDNETHLLL